MRLKDRLAVGAKCSINGKPHDYGCFIIDEVCEDHIVVHQIIHSHGFFSQQRKLEYSGPPIIFPLKSITSIALTNG